MTLLSDLTNALSLMDGGARWREAVAEVSDGDETREQDLWRAFTAAKWIVGNGAEVVIVRHAIKRAEGLA